MRPVAWLVMASATLGSGSKAFSLLDSLNVRWPGLAGAGLPCLYPGMVSRMLRCLKLIAPS